MGNLTLEQLYRRDMGAYHEDSKVFIENINDVLYWMQQNLFAKVNCKLYFKAKDALGRIYRYQYIGLCPDGCGYDLKLYNLDTENNIQVEPQWFFERTITAITL